MSPAGQDHQDERRGGLVRRVLSSGPNPEERLEELLAIRRRELDEHAERLRESIAELERREELLRDSRASVERMLRLGTSDLEARETELAGFLDEITERESRLSEAEDDLARRRQELGAVELKRAALENRERAVEARLADVEAREASLAAREHPAESEVALAFAPGERYRLVEIEPVVLGIGATYELEGEMLEVLRVGRSPLPGDDRRCAYLVRGKRDLDDESGSS